MKAKELRERSEEELQVIEADLRKDLFQSRIRNHTNQLSSTATLRTLRRSLARVATLRHERVLKAKGETP